MNANDVDMVEVMVDRCADRPGSDDRGGQVVGGEPCPESLTGEEDLIAEAGVDPIFSTAEAAEFFDRSNQWLYWGLREGVFTYEDGTPIELERTGDPNKGRRLFTLPLIEEIMMSSYRRGNLSQDQLRTIKRRIKFTQHGVEWREREGWRYVNMGRNRRKWVRPDLAVKRSGEWRMKPKAARAKKPKDTE